MPKIIWHIQCATCQWGRDGSGGIQGGRVIGSSDSKGAFPLNHPVTPQDVLATLYRHLGVNVDKHYLDHAGRPIATLSSGSPILGLF